MSSSNIIQTVHFHYFLRPEWFHTNRFLAEGIKKFTLNGMYECWGSVWANQQIKTMQHAYNGKMCVHIPLRWYVQQPSETSPQKPCLPKTQVQKCGDIVGITAYVEVCCGRDGFDYSIKALWKSPKNILNIVNCINAFTNKKVSTWIFLSGLTLHYITKFLNFMIAGRVIMMNDGSPSKQHWHLLGFHLL